MIQELHFPWLEVGIVLPLIGAGICACLTDSLRAQKIAIAVSALTLLLSIGEWADFSMVGSFEAHDHWDLMQQLTGRDNILVIDELSAPLPALGIPLSYQGRPRSL